MSKGNSHKRKIEKFKKSHPEGGKQFAKNKIAERLKKRMKKKDKSLTAFWRDYIITGNRVIQFAPHCFVESIGADGYLYETKIL